MSCLRLAHVTTCTDSIQIPLVLVLKVRGHTLRSLYLVLAWLIEEHWELLVQLVPADVKSRSHVPQLKLVQHVSISLNVPSQMLDLWRERLSIRPLRRGLDQSFADRVLSVSRTDMGQSDVG